MKISILLLCCLSMVACSKKKSFMKMGSDQLAAMSGILEDKNTLISYNETTNSITLKGTVDGQENSATAPLSIAGLRVGGLNDTSAAQVCELLGFTEPDKFNTTTVDDLVARQTESTLTGKGRSYMRDVFTPVLHIEPLLNTALGTLFNYLTKVTTTYFDYQELSNLNGNSLFAAKDLYLHSITCYGVDPNTHFAPGAEFSEAGFTQEGFINRVFESKLAEQMQAENNLYNLHTHFLVAPANEVWKVDENYSKQYVFVNPKNNFLDVAEAGAKEICARNGKVALLSYSLKYELNDTVPETVYKFNESASIWEEGPRPAAKTFKIKQTDYGARYEAKTTVPSVYLDYVFCI